MHESTNVGSPPRSSQRLVAATVTGLHALVLLGFALFYAYEIVIGAASQLGPAVMSGLLIALFAVGLYGVSRAWLSPETWQRTPTIVWCLLLLPVAYSLGTSGQPIVGAAVAMSAVLGLWAAWTTPSDPPPGD